MANETILQKLAPDNPANPFDSAGVWHNIILDSVKAFLDTPGYKEYSQVTLYIYKFSQIHLQIHPQDLSHLSAKILADTTNYFTNVIASGPLPRTTKNYVLSLLEILRRADGDASFHDIKEHILEFENSVICNVQLASGDRQIILQASSIARYSAYHWLRIYNSIPAEQAQAGPLRWFVTVASDVTAGVGGIVGGGNGGVKEVATTAAAASSYWYHFLSAF